MHQQPALLPAHAENEEEWSGRDGAEYAGANWWIGSRSPWQTSGCELHVLKPCVRTDPASFCISRQAVRGDMLVGKGALLSERRPGSRSRKLLEIPTIAAGTANPPRDSPMRTPFTTLSTRRRLLPSVRRRVAWIPLGSRITNEEIQY